MFELGFSKTFVVVDCPISYQLNLRNARDGFEIGMEDGLFVGFGSVVAVAVVLRMGIKGLFVIEIVDVLSNQKVNLVTYLCQCILLFRSKLYIPEKQSFVLDE